MPPELSFYDKLRLGHNSIWKQHSDSENNPSSTTHDNQQTHTPTSSSSPSTQHAKDLFLSTFKPNGNELEMKQTTPIKPVEQRGQQQQQVLATQETKDPSRQQAETQRTQQQTASTILQQQGSKIQVNQQTTLELGEGSKAEQQIQPHLSQPSQHLQQDKKTHEQSIHHQHPQRNQEYDVKQDKHKRPLIGIPIDVPQKDPTHKPALSLRNSQVDSANTRNHVTSNRPPPNKLSSKTGSHYPARSSPYPMYQNNTKSYAQHSDMEEVDEDRDDNYHRRLHIPNLPPQATKDEVWSHFERYGVISVNKKYGKTYGFVEFESLDACLLALRMEDRQEFQGVNIRLKRSRPRTGNGNHEETAKEVPDVFSRLEYCAQHDPHTHSNRYDNDYQHDVLKPSPSASTTSTTSSSSSKTATDYHLSKQRNSRTDRSYDYYAPSYHYRSSRSPDRSSYHHPSYRYSSSSNKSGYAVSSYDYEKSRSRSKSSHHPDTSREGQYNNGDISPSTSGRQKSPPKRSDTKTAPTDPRKRPVPTPDQTETDIKRSKTDGIKKDGTDEDQGITSNSKENGKDNTQTSGDMGLATNDQMAKDDGKLDTAKNSHDDSIIKSPNRATTMPEMKNITTGISSATPSVENTTSMTTSATPSAENTAPMIISTSPMTTGATCTTPMTTSTTRPAPMTISATPITTSTIASTTSTAPVTTTNVSATLDLPATTGEELLPLTKAPLTSISTSTTPSLSSQTTNNKQTDQEINTIKQSTSINSNHIAGEPPHLQPTTSVSGQLHNVTASQQTPLSFINIADEKTVIQLICVGTAIQPNAIGHLEDYLTLHLPKLKCRTMVFPAGLASREDVLKQVHMDGVNALLLLENGFEEHGKVFLQVYDQQHGGKDSLHFDEYEGISVIDAVYIIQQAIQKTKEITSPTTIPATATPLSFLNRGSPSTVKAEPLAMQPYSLPEQQTQLQEKHQAQIQVQQQQQIAADLIQQLNHKSGGPSTMTNSGLTPPPAAAAAGVTALTLNAPTGQVSPASTAITLYDNSPDVNQSNLCLLSKVLDYLANSEQQQYTLGSYNSRRTIILQTLMNMKTFQPPLRPEQEYAVSSNLIMYLQRLNPPHPPAPIYQTHWQYGPSSSSGPYYNIH